MTRAPLVALALAALLHAAAQAAHAETDTMTVRVGDLDVSHIAGAQIAYARIRLAARVFCGDHGIRDTDQFLLERACFARMTTKGVEALQAPMVTALYEGRRPVEAGSPIELAAARAR